MLLLKQVLTLFFRLYIVAYLLVKPVQSHTTYCLVGEERKGESFCSHSSCFQHICITGNREILVSSSAMSIHWLRELVFVHVLWKTGWNSPPESSEETGSIGWFQFWSLRPFLGGWMAGAVVAQGFVHISCSMWCEGSELSFFLLLSSLYHLSLLHALKQLFLHHPKKETFTMLK